MRTFAEFVALKEMASFSVRAGGFVVPCKFILMSGMPCEEKEIGALDMRFEDPGAYKPPFNSLNQGSKFIAQLPGSDTYLVYDGAAAQVMNRAQVEPMLPQKPNEESEQGYYLLPNDWVIHAEFYDKNWNVFKPALADFTGARSKFLHGKDEV